MRDLIEQAQESLTQTEASLQEVVRGIEREFNVTDLPIDPKIKLRLSDAREELLHALDEMRGNIREMNKRFREQVEVNRAERRGGELNRALTALRLELPEEIVRSLTEVIDRRLDRT